MPETLARKSLYGFEYRETDLRRSEERKTHDIKSLWQRSHEIISLALRGLKQTEIADILNIEPQTVSNTLNSELGMQKLSKMREKRDVDAVKVSRRIEILTQKALNVYEDIFDNKDERASVDQQRKSADTVMLELSGHRVPVRVDSRHISTRATLEEIEDFKKRGIKAARDAGMIVELPEEIRHEEVTE